MTKKCLINPINVFQTVNKHKAAQLDCHIKFFIEAVKIPVPLIQTNLLAQLINDGLETAVVVDIGTSLLQGLADLHLQLAVGLLQEPHFLQVGGQTVIQVLHGHLLVAHDLTCGSGRTHVDGAGH